MSCAHVLSWQELRTDSDSASAAVMLPPSLRQHRHLTICADALLRYRHAWTRVFRCRNRSRRLTQFARPFLSRSRPCYAASRTGAYRHLRGLPPSCRPSSRRWRRTRPAASGWSTRRHDCSRKTKSSARSRAWSRLCDGSCRGARCLSSPQRRQRYSPSRAAAASTSACRQWQCAAGNLGAVTPRHPRQLRHQRFRVHHWTPERMAMPRRVASTSTRRRQ